MNIEETAATPEEGAVYDDVNDFCRAYFDLVPKVAQQVYRERGVVEPDDIAQAIWETVVKKFDAAFSGIEFDEVKRRFRRVGRDYVAKEAVDLQYFRGNYLYSPDEIRNLLTTSVWSSPETIEKVDGKVDVQSVYAQLSPKQKQAVYKRYGLGIPDLAMSESESRNCRYGVENMCHRLNKLGRFRALRIDAMEEYQGWEHGVEDRTFLGGLGAEYSARHASWAERSESHH